ncbi:host-nuclease inhibitor Gam family protein [Sphingomonas sp. 3-13AW]|uniref:host-nuclease inhibitor Gam family protein n=1 Tax=Sphingomonas sp. 3-13AW TaxID=3050450 RepID=UPI003BB7A291
MTLAPAIKTPRTVAKATELLDRFASLSTALEKTNGDRNAEIAKINAAADVLAAPIVAELAKIEAAIAAWWKTAEAEITKGKRKSAELGGCMLGTRTGRTTLAIAGEVEAVLTKLQAARWAKPYVRTTHAIDKAAALKALDGPHAKQLSELGFSKQDGQPVFFLERVAQAGTVGSAAS